MKRNTTTIAAAALMGAAASLALGDLPPGYVWGIANCGPAHTDTATQCHNCCGGAQRDGTINSIERDGCDQMCDESNFTRPDTFLRSFFRHYRPFWL